MVRARLPRKYAEKEFPYYWPSGAKVDAKVRKDYFRKLEGH